MIALGAMLFALMLTFDLLHEKSGLFRFRMLSLGVATSAVLALVSGIALLIWSDQGAAFYFHNPVFYIKLAVFIAMLLIAITPASHELPGRRYGYQFIAMLLIAITPARVIHQWHRDAMSSETGTGASGRQSHSARPALCHF